MTFHWLEFLFEHNLHVGCWFQFNWCYSFLCTYISWGWQWKLLETCCLWLFCSANAAETPDLFFSILFMYNCILYKEKKTIISPLIDSSSYRWPMVKLYIWQQKNYLWPADMVYIGAKSITLIHILRFSKQFILLFIKKKSIFM